MTTYFSICHYSSSQLPVTSNSESRRAIKERMKGPTIFLLVAICSSSLAVALEEDAANQMKFQTFYSGRASSLHRSLRQVPERTSDKCYAISEVAKCSSSYSQIYINVLSECGEQAIGTIIQTEYACRKNRDGKYCGEAVSPSLSLDIFWGKCFYGCSRSCRQLLMTAMEQVGCCVHVFSDKFEACGMSLPSPCPKSNLIIPSITHDKGFCRDYSKFTENQFLVSCQYRSPIIYALRYVSCFNLARAYNSRCSTRNGRYCLLELDAFSQQAYPSAQEPIRTASTDCPSVSNCSSQCYSSLTKLKEEVGCCVHAVNLTQGQFGSLEPAILNYSLWSECNITIPKSCSALSKAENLVSDLSVFFTIILVSLVVGISQGSRDF